MFELQGRKALVTGSTQGIGKAIATCLLEHGAEVWVHGATSLEKCRKAADEMSGRVHTVLQDLSSPDCAENLYSETGDLDILVLNASVQFRKTWDQITLEEFDRQIHTNLRASLLLIQKYAPAMLEKKWGRIVTVGSVQEYKPHKDMAIYAASKSAQMNLVRNLAKQFAPNGVTVNNMSPGVIATPRNEAALKDPVYSAQVMAGIPLGYAAEAEDCTGAVLLLCSEEGRYITGIDLVVDGGMSL